MTLEDAMKMGIYELGGEVITHVIEYHTSSDPKALANIYLCLVAIGNKVLYDDASGVEPHIIEDWIYTIAEDTVLMIKRNPSKFITHDNFFGYYKAALRITAKKMVAQKYFMLDNFDPLEYSKVDDYPLFSIVDNTDIHLAKVDECGVLVNEVLRVIKKFPRFSEKAEYLVWPILFSVIDKSDEVLNFSGNQRDRMVMKLIMRMTEQTIPRKIHALKD